MAATRAKAAAAEGATLAVCNAPRPRQSGSRSRASARSSGPRTAGVGVAFIVGIYQRVPRPLPRSPAPVVTHARRPNDNRSHLHNEAADPAALDPRQIRIGVWHGLVRVRRDDDSHTRDFGTLLAYVARPDCAGIFCTKCGGVVAGLRGRSWSPDHRRTGLAGGGLRGGHRRNPSDPARPTHPADSYAALTPDDSRR